MVHGGWMGERTGVGSVGSLGGGGGCGSDGGPPGRGTTRVKAPALLGSTVTADGRGDRGGEDLRCTSAPPVPVRTSRPCCCGCSTTQSHGCTLSVEARNRNILLAVGEQ